MNNKESNNIPAAFFQMCDRIPNCPGLKFKKNETWQVLNFREYKERVIALATFLKNSGIHPGDRLAILSNNRPEWLISDLAIMSVKAVSVPLYSTLQKDQVRYILAETESRFIFVEDKVQLEKVRSVVNMLPHLELIVVMDPLGVDLNPMTISFEESIQTGLQKTSTTRLLDQDIADQIQREDLASIVYTSGTTGEPKGVMLTHGNFLSNGYGVLDAYKASSDDVVLSLLPLSHVLEKTGGFITCHVLSGACYAFAESIEKVASNMVEIAPTIMVAVPRLYEKMYARIVGSVQAGSKLKKHLFTWALSVGQAYQRNKRLGKSNFLVEYQHRIAQALVFRKIHEKTGGRLRYLISGGAPLEPKIGEFFCSVNLLIFEGYGLTETSPVANANRPGHYKIGSVGQPIRGVLVKTAPDGEILIQGPNIMKGYYKKPEATQEVFTKDGWFKTGDIGRIDEDGYLWITDRKKEIMVTSGGKNIAPQPIENHIKSNPLVNQIMLIGDRRNFITALVVPDFIKLREWAAARGIGGDLSDSQLISHAEIVRYMTDEIQAMTDHLPRFEQVKKVTLLDRDWSIETGELTPTLKLKRRVIYEKFRDIIDRSYEDLGDSNGFRQ